MCTRDLAEPGKSYPIPVADLLPNRGTSGQGTCGPPKRAFCKIRFRRRAIQTARPTAPGSITRSGGFLSVQLRHAGQLFSIFRREWCLAGNVVPGRCPPE